MTMTRDEFARHLGFPGRSEMEAASTDLGPQGEDVSWLVTALPDGRFAAWDDAELAADRVEYFPTHNEAAQHQIDGAVEDYCIHHQAEEDGVDVCMCTHGDDGPVIGFRLSLDVDGRSRGEDKRFGSWGE